MKLVVSLAKNAPRWPYIAVEVGGSRRAGPRPTADVTMQTSRCREQLRCRKDGEQLHRGEKHQDRQEHG